MSNLVAITFEDQKTAFDMRAKLVELQSEYLIEMDDVVVVTRDAEGKVKLHQAVNLTATGAVGGSFWGMLIGMLFLNPLVGLAAGAGSGALAGLAVGCGDQRSVHEGPGQQPDPGRRGDLRDGAQIDAGQGDGSAKRVPGQGQGAANQPEQGFRRGPARLHRKDAGGLSGAGKGSVL